jgi:hypothetical protein
MFVHLDFMASPPQPICQMAWKMHLHDEKIDSLLSEFRRRDYFMLTNAKAIATATRAP